MPLVAVNAGGLPEGTFESEIFGHVKGAFTDARTDRIGRFELANGGTLFLDEIANVPLRQQAKLLRVLETGELERVGSSQTGAWMCGFCPPPTRCCRGSQGRQLPRGSAVPHQHGRDSSARAARAARRYSAAGRAFSAIATGPAIASRSAAFRRRPCSR
jgi:hypothetical protein